MNDTHLFIRLFVSFLMSLGSQTLAVPLYLINKTNKDMRATARDNMGSLISVPAHAHRVFIENITPSDTLTIWQAQETTPWGVFRITLGGQRNEPLYLTIAEPLCGQFNLLDPLHEPGEGGYAIQVLHENRLPPKNCPL